MRGWCLSRLHGNMLWSTHAKRAFMTPEEVAAAEELSQTLEGFKSIRVSSSHIRPLLILALYVRDMPTCACPSPSSRTFSHCPRVFVPDAREVDAKRRIYAPGH